MHIQLYIIRAQTDWRNMRAWLIWDKPETRLPRMLARLRHLTMNPTGRQNFQQIPAVLLLAILLLAGCSKPGLSPIRHDGKILAYGDSLTQGVGADWSTSYPAVLEVISGHVVINAGVSGETTTEGLTRLPRVLSESNPDLMILLEGGNDIIRNIPPLAIKANLAAMIEIAQAANVQVVLLGVPKKSVFASIAPLYGELASEYGLVFEEELVSDLLRSPDYKSDPIHLNATGYRVLAESINELLQSRGAY